MSLKHAIERAGRNGHPESMGLGFESHEFPEIEEGVHLFRELGIWLADKFPGRMISWNLQCSKMGADHGTDLTRRSVTLEAEALLQGYRNFGVYAGESPALVCAGDRLELFGRGENHQPLDGYSLIAGWRVGVMEDEMKSGGHLYRLRVRLQTNRMVWATPQIRLDTSMVNFRVGDGTPINIVDVSDDKVWNGGLERGLARVIARSVVPALTQKVGEVEFKASLLQKTP